MSATIIQALQFILCLSLLILLHEGGHFLFAKLFKIRVERFCLFFDYKFTLWKYKPRRSHTTYAIGWIPLGGYVKIAGMIDESMDKEQLKQPIQPWEFRAKPAWQRLLVMLGGVMVNLLVAFFIYAMLLFAYGTPEIKQRDMTHGFKFNERAQELGFRDGDIPLHTDNARFDTYDFRLVGMYRTLTEAGSVTVLRQGKEVTFALPADLSLLDMTGDDPRFAEALIPSRVDSVFANSPAALAGLKAGDHIVSIDGTPINSYNEYAHCVATRRDILVHGNPTDSLRLRTLTLGVQRSGTTTTDTLTLQLGSDYLAGFAWTPLNKLYPVATVHYTFLQSIPAGISRGWHTLCNYVSDLQYVFTSQGVKSVGSFLTMGSLFPAEWDWVAFWNLCAFLSLMLAFLNVLPIPALDGGHALFLLYEVVTRRKLSDTFMERAQMVGMVLLLLLMALALFNDLVRFVF